MHRTTHRLAALALLLAPACTFRYAPDAGADATAESAVLVDAQPPRDAPAPDALAPDVTDAPADRSDAPFTPDASDANDANDANDAAPDVRAPDVIEAGLDAAADATVDAAADAPIDAAPDAPVDVRPDVLAPDVLAPDAPLDALVPDAPPTDAQPDARTFEVGANVDAGACGANFTVYEQVPGLHVALDAGLLDANPPHSGDHFGEWARWGLHDMVIPRHYWVHNLEHGGVVILYRCDGDCSTLRAQLRAFVLGLPEEPTCAGSGVARRVLLTEDPLLVGPAVAAVSWGFVYRATCLDAASLRSFVAERIGRAPESVCGDGFYPP